MSKLALIPARAGSKRIKDKNIIEFCGKSMILHVLEELKKSSLFDEIHVSTDSEKIKNIVEENGFNIPFLRPSNISDDFTPVLEVAKWTLSQYQAKGFNFDSFCLVMPCTPMLESSDFTRAYEIFETYKGEHSLLAVSRYPSPPEWAFEKNKQGILTAKQPNLLTKRSQDFKQSFFDTGTFSIHKSDQVMNSKVSVITKLVPYELQAHKAIDIDEPSDLELAEKYFKAFKAP